MEARNAGSIALLQNVGKWEGVIFESKAHCSSGVFDADHLFTNSEKFAGGLTCGMLCAGGDGADNDDATSRVAKIWFSPFGLKIPPPTLLGRMLSRVCFASLKVGGAFGLTSTRDTGAGLGTDFVPILEVDGEGGGGEGEAEAERVREETALISGSAGNVSLEAGGMGWVESTMSIGTRRRRGGAASMARDVATFFLALIFSSTSSIALEMSLS